ncbi:MAG: hypothetical protein WCL08_04015 [Verrucomicrobiota bacterium]
MNKKIIGLTAFKGSGKTTVARKLQNSPFLPKDVAILSFASPLKEMAAVLLAPEAFLPENKEDPNYGICGRSPRHIMQTLGTEWGREKISPHLWLEIMRRRIKSCHSPTVIVDDVRFDNEAELLADLGGKIFRVEREGVKGCDSHVSERSIDEYWLDGIIVNRTLEDLDSMVRIWNPYQ